MPNMKVAGLIRLVKWDVENRFMFENKRQNQLLYFGAGIFFCTFFIYFILSNYYPSLIKSPSRLEFFDNNSILTIVVSALIVAPVVEEIIFRGFFLKKKIFIFSFYVGSVIMIILTKNYYLLILPASIFLLEYLIKIPNLWIVSFLNTLLFGLIHYKMTDFTSIYEIIPIFFQFSLGLILAWITINFGLKKSILTHFSINFVIILPFLFVLQFPKKQENRVIVDDNNLKWQKTTLIGTTRISYSNHKVYAERVTINQFINLFHNKELDFKINDSLRFFRYNFELENTELDKIDPQDLKTILLKSKLVAEK